MKNRIRNINEKVKKFFIRLKNKDTSFFIVALCVLLLATALVWRYTSNNGNSLADNETDKGDIANVDPYEDYISEIIEGYGDKESEEAVDLNTLNAPLAGEVIREFIMDDLVFYEAIGEWRVHRGIDIKPKESLMVESAFEGTVEKVSTTELAGTEIIIDHGNNIKTLYSNLSSAKVKAGDIVKKGQEIGNVGKCDSIESADGPHLHFELIVEGESINPLDYIPGE